MSDTSIPTYRSLANDIQMSFDADGSPHRGSRFPISQIVAKLLTSRSSVYRRSKEARQGISEQCIQTIPCIPLEKADKEICPCAPPSGCIWLRSKDPIPKAIFLNTVSNSSANFTAQFVDWTQFDLKLSGRSFKKGDKYYTFLDSGNGSYLYLYNTKKLKNIAITGVFEDPVDAITFEGCETMTKKQKEIMCSPFDAPLYMDGRITDIVCALVTDFFAKKLQLGQPDLVNNDREDRSGINTTV